MEDGGEVCRPTGSINDVGGYGIFCGIVTQPPDNVQARGTYASMQLDHVLAVSARHRRGARLLTAWAVRIATAVHTTMQMGLVKDILSIYNLFSLWVLALVRGTKAHPVHRGKGMLLFTSHAY